MVIGHELIDFYDPELDVTSIGRNTTYPTSRIFKERSVLHCVKIGKNPKTAEIYFAELAKRNIRITESVSKSQ